MFEFPKRKRAQVIQFRKDHKGDFITTTKNKIQSNCDYIIHKKISMKPLFVMQLFNTGKT